MKRWMRVMAALALGALAAPGPALAVGGPREAEVTGATCPAARDLATKKAGEVCAKHGGVSWTEYSVDCDADPSLLPGVPVTLQVHFLCGADL